MPFESKTEEWVKKIQLILSNKNENDLENIYHVNRKKFLKKLEFKSLALKLKNIIIK